MRRVLALVALLLAAPAPAAAQWGESAMVELGSSRPATCLRDAGAAQVSALAWRGSRFGATLYAAGPEGLRSDGEVLFGHGVVECPVAAAAASGAAVVAAPMVSTPRPPSQRLLVAVRDPGAGFAEPVEVARMRPRQGGLQASVAVGGDGSALVAWRESYDDTRHRRGRVVVRVVRRGPGQPFGAPQTLLDRPFGPWASQVDVIARLDGAGRATVAWAQPRPPQQGGRIKGLSSIAVASAAPGARFAEPSMLAEDVQHVTVVALAVAPDGRALLSHDSLLGIQVYEREPGAAAFGSGTTFGGVEHLAGRPAVALAPDGTAVVAWRDGDAVDAVARTGIGAWGPVARLQRAPRRGLEGIGFGLSAYSTEGPPVDEDDGRPRAAAAVAGAVMVGWREAPTPAGGPARAWVASASAGALAPAAALGSPVRDVDALVPVIAAGGPAAVWADNGAFSVADIPVGDGRLHLADATEPIARLPAPRIRVVARPQSLHHREPLVVHVHCAAACDLRAVVAPRRSRGDADRRDGAATGPAVGVGGRGDAGRVTLRVKSTSGSHIAPPDGGNVRVILRATAPGGARASRAVSDVRVRRRPVPPLSPPRDVRARRAGDDVIVTWRTDGPARRMHFLAFTRQTRGRRPTAGSSVGGRDGRRRQHFRLRLRDASRARFVVLFAYATDPPPRKRTVLVAIR